MIGIHSRLLVDKVLRASAKKMPSGKEMDELITRHVISNDGFWHGRKNYSTDMGAAWEVVEKMGGCNLYCCEVGLDVIWVCGMRGEEVEAPTAPLAICRAALFSINPV